MHPDVFDLAALPGDARLEIESGAGDMQMDRLLNVLRALPKAAELLAAHGIGHDVIRDTYSDIGIWARTCLRETGRYGLTTLGYEWLQNHLGGKLYRVGRLQCCPGKLGSDFNIRVFRHRATGRALALVDGERSFRADGQLSGTNGIEAGPDGFAGYSAERLRDGRATVDGTVISPLGRALNRLASLNLNEWDEILREGANVFQLHIPEGGGYTVEATRDSLMKMRKFAEINRRAIAELCGVDGGFAAFAMGSWVLDEQLTQLLGESNLVKCLREYYLVPALADDEPTLMRVFGTVTIDPERADASMKKTGLQRAILEFMRRGGRMRYNFGFVLFNDAASFGSGKYRADFEILARSDFWEG